MDSTINLSQINLGADSAEQDIKVGLLDYFLENPSYKNIISGKKRIVVGNRGVGKTAIFKYAAENEHKRGSIVIELSPEDYSYDLLSSMLKKESEGSWGKQGSYSISWQFLIYNLVFKELVSQLKHVKRGSIKEIHNYVRDNFIEKSIDSPLDIFISYLKRLEGVKFGKYEIGIKKKDLYKLYELQEIKELFPHLKDVLDQHRVNIYIDELDKGWDNSEDAKYFIAGLLQATQRINELHDNLKVFVSIRQELFDNIPQIYEDAQKIRGTIETIRWNEEELLVFITKRISHSLPNYGQYEANKLWSMVFQETLEYRQMKSFNYIIDRTQLRPREFLQFTRECINQVKSHERLVNYDDISRASINYSEYKTKDLVSEYRFQFPGLLDLFNTFRGKKYTMDKDDLDFHLLELCSGGIPIQDAAWVTQIDYFDLKKILWEIGFLKAWVIGGLKSGRKSGSAYLGHYELSSISLDLISRFQIHPAFWAYLALKEK